ncbi:hypothetical protein D3879_14880 [Pseudomonas cavernicola]|uniref:Uncharacterized protein n=1 Tax=Pseudomonas cavernicola TaxID=2320866 RepID=A0A418XEZ2_9PSED|nr:hypothetical protein [Pseudomonas cavernicola]RJG10960.1 hypothetical protein D3879_14880 [Pseudomonas cavernicola]
MKHSIEVDEYQLEVEITSVIDTPPDSSSWASPDDYYGCRELEFSVVSGVIYDEDGNTADLGRNGCAAVAELHAELIEELLWRVVDAQKENAAFDRAEARAEKWRAA